MTFRNLLRAVLFALFALAAISPAAAQPIPAPTTRIPVSALPPLAQASAKFDAEKATNAYLAEVSGAARKKSDAYFEGGYVLQFVDCLYALVVAAILLWSRLSAAIRNYAAGITRSRFWQVPIYIAALRVACENGVDAAQPVFAFQSRQSID